ncbi:unnamed protein product [Brassica oleracea var. botrytis]|uniref:(rape) hypothetical protein n=1 Tax=Brassica napus TaxID=3708 RepID=A0A816UNS6_BRANA|nr:unnamed protein product [Brassica napus]
MASRVVSTSKSRYITTSTPDPAKATNIPSLATRQKPTKSSSLENRSGSSAIRSSSYGLKSNNTAENKQKEVSKSGETPVEKTRLQKSSKFYKAGVVDAKTRRDSLNLKAKPMQGSFPVRSLPKGSSEKVL